MAGETIITVIGNLTVGPRAAVHAVRRRGRQLHRRVDARAPSTVSRSEWKDGEALFLRCNVWRQAAENVAESLTRGSRVIVSGRLKQRSYETKEGEKRTVIELEVDEIGPSLRYATAKVTKASRGEGGGGSAPVAAAAEAAASPVVAVAARATPGRRLPASDEPPF